jgi:hypothetical protein
MLHKCLFKNEDWPVRTAAKSGFGCRASLSAVLIGFGTEMKVIMKKIKGVIFLLFIICLTCGTGIYAADITQSVDA